MFLGYAGIRVANLARSLCVCMRGLGLVVARRARWTTGENGSSSKILDRIR